MKFRKATIDDWEVLLNWRNNFETRQNSKNKEFISKETHIKWLNSILENPKRHLFIAIEDTTPVGNIRADYIEKEKAYYLSWIVAPKFRGRGFGKKIVKLLVNKVKEKMIAEIKEENIPSIKIAEFVGMKRGRKKNDFLYYSIKG